MKATSISLKLPADHIQFIREQSRQPGEGLNNILDAYQDPGQIAAAVSRHIVSPSKSPQETKATSFYLAPDRIQSLRGLMSRTYLPFEGVLRILVQDYIQQHQL